MVFTFLVNQDSVYNYGAQGFAEPHFGSLDHSGQAMFSLDDSKYAICVRGGGLADGSPKISDSFAPGKICIADFDRCTGKLSNAKVYRTEGSPCANLDPN